MLSPTFLALLLVVTTSVAATSLDNRAAGRSVSLPFTKRVNAKGARDLVRLDQARAQSLKNRTIAQQSGPDSFFDFPVTNGVVSYTATVSVGNPPTDYELIVDTGSSNTWVGANTEYTPTDTSEDTGDSVVVFYGSGFFVGEEFNDLVNIGGLLFNQSIGAADFAVGFDGVDGILGIGPTGLTVGTLNPDSDASIPTVTDNLFTEGLISANIVGISFEPTDTDGNQNGELTFGGIDTSKFVGDIQDVPITSTSPASEFVGIDQAVTYGTDGASILALTAGIVDTGTTLTLLATDAFNAYMSATGAVADDATGLLTLTEDQFDSLESLFFNIDGESYELTANAQIWPRTLNTAIGGTEDAIYLIVGDLGSNSGQGLDFINGMTFLERFYTTFDSGASTFGIAKTPFTDATSN